jgi:hypothetical protein
MESVAVPPKRWAEPAKRMHDASALATTPVQAGPLIATSARVELALPIDSATSFRAADVERHLPRTNGPLHRC